MKSLPVAVLLFWAVAATPAAAQGLLPPSFSNWNAAASSAITLPPALEQVPGADPAVLREYGTQSVERRMYSRGAMTLSATLYRTQDPTSAFGLYTYMLSEPMAAANLSRYSSLSRERALVLVGSWLLEVNGKDLRPLAPDLKALVDALASRADRTPYPTIGQHLPTGGLLRNSVRYLLGPVALQHVLPLGRGDWIGLADGAEAELARYRLEGQPATLLLISYPTPQMAARKLEQMGRWFALNPSEKPSDGRPSVFVRRTSSLVALVSETPSRTLADSLLEQIHYETEVTWNEPTHRLTDPTISEIVIGAFLGTGVILFFTLLAGLGFSGVRILVKYLFPGRVFDRAPQVEILQLGLSSKPIEAKDFYWFSGLFPKASRGAPPSGQGPRTS
jgi:hypothetical protein